MVGISEQHITMEMIQRLEKECNCVIVRCINSVDQWGWKAIRNGEEIYKEKTFEDLLEKLKNEKLTEEKKKELEGFYDCKLHPMCREGEVKYWVCEKDGVLLPMDSDTIAEMEEKLIKRYKKRKTEWIMGNDMSGFGNINAMEPKAVWSAIEPKKPILEFDYVITNGYVDAETLSHRKRKGWEFVATVPAKSVHPLAMPEDKITIFSRYNGEKKNEI